MKKLTLTYMIVLISLSIFTGCLSEDEKKAKDIAVKKIIDNDIKEKENRENKGKSADFRGFSTKVWDK